MQMTISQLQSMWMVDYGAARDRAIGWLGQRYLLATPVNRVLAMEVRTSGRLSRAPSLGMSIHSKKEAVMTAKGVTTLEFGDCWQGRSGSQGDRK
jgi:hypothetical protein